MIPVPHNPSRVIRAWTRSDFDFTLSSIARMRTISGVSGGQLTDRDTVLNQQTAATVETEYDLVLVGDTPRAWSVESLHPSVAAVTDLRVSRVADGTATVVVRTPQLSRRLDLTMVREVGATSQQFSHYVSGSLARHCYDGVFSRIENRTPSDATMLLYSSVVHTSASYTLNPDCWLSGIDTSAISVYTSSSGGFMQAVVAISPRHVLGTAHYFPGNGSVIRFRGSDGVVVERVLTSGVDVQAGRIGLLNEDLPETVTPPPLLPANISTRAPGAMWSFPGVRFDRFRRVSTGRIMPWSAVYHGAPEDVFATWSVSVSGGDSGSPIFLLIEGRLALMGHIVSNILSGGAGPSLHLYVAEINAAMASLGGGYQVTTIDLSAYPTY